MTPDALSLLAWVAWQTPPHLLSGPDPSGRSLKEAKVCMGMLVVRVTALPRPYDFIIHVL